MTSPQPPAPTAAWAVAQDGRILVKTVHDSRRAAIVNWLCTERGVMALALTTDIAIEDAWRQMKGDGITVLQVAVSDKLLARPDGEAEPVAWRCFHCDEVFTTAETARAHFGVDDDYEPGCMLKLTEGEKDLHRELDRLNTQLKRYHEEDSDKDRQIAVLQSEHAAALRREEEAGYAKGLRDARDDAAKPDGEAEPVEYRIRLSDDPRSEWQHVEASGWAQHVGRYRAAGWIVEPLYAKPDGEAVTAPCHRLSVGFEARR